MRRILLACWLVAMPATALSAGLDVTWNDCVGGNPQLNQVFNCNANATYVLNFQFKLPVSISGFMALTAQLDYQNSSGTPLTPFWHFETGGCAMTPNNPGLEISSDLESAPGACPTLADPWAGGSETAVIVNYAPDFARPGNARYLLTVARPTPIDLVAGDNYWAFRLIYRTNHRSQCAGCSDPGCVAWSYALMESSDASPFRLEGADKMSEGVAFNNGNVFACIPDLPVQPTTWGKIKGLWR